MKTPEKLNGFPGRKISLDKFDRMMYNDVGRKSLGNT